MTFLICSAVLFAQNKNPGVDSLLKQGVALNDAGKFAEAITKYDEALKIEPNNMTALYEKGYTLSVSGKADEAIPCFEKVIASRQMPNAYVALANIYDTRGDFTQAEKYYTQGIAAYPNYGSLWYNLGLCYLHQKKYEQAGAAAVESIKINQKHVASYQIYGFANYFQGKNAMALLGLSNFLMLVPPIQQGRVASAIVKQILNAKPDAKAEPMAKMQQEIIAKAVASATVGKTDLKGADSVSLQLKSAFKAINEQSAQYKSAFFEKYFGDFFGALANSDHMDVFTRVITVGLWPQENVIWLGTHIDGLKTYDAWKSSQTRVIQ
ncbi:MAG TPA: tetratricopeptide repeat protein [Mucilaginibacter sp.]